MLDRPVRVARPFALACALASVLVVLGAVTPAAHADGKMLAVPTRSAPELPWQRALILYDEGQQLLAVQSAAATPDAEEGGSAGSADAGEDGGADARVGWLLPVPATPVAIGSLHSLDWHVAWRRLLLQGRPDAFDVSDALVAGLLVALPATTLVLVVLSVLPGRSPRARRRDRRQAGTLGVLTVLAVLAFVGPALLLPTLGQAAGPPGVWIERHVQAGIHDVRVVAGDDARAVVAFIRDAGFEVDDPTAVSIADHVQRGWRFVLSEIDLAASRGDPAAPDPLVLRFAVDEPVYPLALTGTGRTPTEVAVAFVVRADARGTVPTDRGEAATSSDAGPPVTYRGPCRRATLVGLFDRDRDDELLGPFAPWMRASGTVDLRLELRQGVLSPEDMQEDLVFDSEGGPDVRRHVVRW